ncbi:Uncharacterised protein [Legionella cherrii]|uniref:Uncharacterized protein n=1 Tax=Legionella cherrii TaxID=28084 RepID=A0ABY6T779_9GAMM|nr:Uncharacterised protein [Legionella cherrii]
MKKASPVLRLSKQRVMIEHTAYQVTPFDKNNETDQE